MPADNPSAHVISHDFGSKRRILRHSSSLTVVPTAIRQRTRALIALCVAIFAATAAPAEADTYGALIARHDTSPSTPLATSFVRVRPRGSFLLVITQQSRAALRFRWSIHCAGARQDEAGGASGAASISSVRWVKRVRVDWINHPMSCSGTVEGLASSSPVLVRVYAAH